MKKIFSTRLPVGARRILSGNLIEHYDNALFGLLTPFLAPLLFPHEEPIIALILGYALMPLSMVAKPLGALFFGRWSSHRGLLSMLKATLLWMGFSSILMGLCPTYSQVGYLAPLLILLARLLQNFCSTSEVIGGGLYLMGRTEIPARGLLNGLYGASTMAGIWLASVAVAALALQDAVESSWRWLFLAGGSVALFGWWLRGENLHAEDHKSSSLSSLTVLRSQIGPLLRKILVAGLSYCCYVVPFALSQGMAPFVAPVSKAQMAEQTPVLMLFDFLILFVVALFSSHIPPRKMMIGVSGALALLFVPLFAAMEGASLLQLMLIRGLLVVLGVLFCMPIRAWSLTLGRDEGRPTLLFVGYALGVQLFGASSASLSLSFLHLTGWAGAAGIYPALLALTVCACLLYEKKSSRVKLAPFPSS